MQLVFGLGCNLLQLQLVDNLVANLVGESSSRFNWANEDVLVVDWNINKLIPSSISTPPNLLQISAGFWVYLSRMKAM